MVIGNKYFNKKRSGVFNMKALTMVMTRGYPNSEPISYIFISDDYSIVEMSKKELAQAILGKKARFTNVDIENGKVVSTNGAFEKYNVINNSTGGLIGKANPVIINRVEVNGEISGYTIFNTSLVLQEVSVEQAVKIHKATPFCNGKLRDTKNGYIISSIKGVYPLRVIEISKKTSEKADVELMFVGSAIGNGNGMSKYAGIIVTCENAAYMSKVYKKLKGDSTKIIQEARKLGATVEDCKSLEIQRVGAAGIYGVFGIDVVKQLINLAGGKVKAVMDTIAIACIDYTDENIESNVKITKDFKIKDSKKGNDRTDRAVKGFISEFINGFKDFEIV